MINKKLITQIFNSLNIKLPQDIEIENLINTLNSNYEINQDFSSSDYSSLIEIREYQLGFTNRLMFNYSKPIQELEIFSELCKSIGNNIYLRLNENKTNTCKQTALRRLHQKSTLIASEIIYLIKGGYASAALSRWRTLLETSIISLFLSVNDDITSERYIDYEIIDTRKELNTYIENVDFLGFENIPRVEIEKIEKEYNHILEKYGNDFKYSNAWAAIILDKKKPNLHDFMNFIDSQYMKPYYKFSNNYVHSGAKSLMYNLGYINGSLKDSTIAAPSNIGFTDPAQLCALSYFNSTLAFLSVSTNEDDLILLLELYSKINHIANSFKNCENQLIESEIEGN